MSSYGTVSISGSDTAQPLNVERRVALLRRVVSLDGARVLDCGCGAGGYVKALRALGVDAYGVEYSETKVAEYQQSSTEPQRVRVGNLEHLTDPDASYDVALLNEVLEHVPNEMAALFEIHRVLRSGGRLVVFSPNRLYPFETHGLRLRHSGKFIHSTRAALVPYLPVAIGRQIFDYPARNYWPRELRRMVEAARFRITHTDFIWQTFENISRGQPSWMRVSAPVLRKLASVLERTPVVRSLGVSQVIVAQRD